jgi:hypothetical protein
MCPVVAITASTLQLITSCRSAGDWDDTQYSGSSPEMSSPAPAPVALQGSPTQVRSHVRFSKRPLVGGCRCAQPVGVKAAFESCIALSSATAKHSAQGSHAACRGGRASAAAGPAGRRRWLCAGRGREQLQTAPGRWRLRTAQRATSACARRRRPSMRVRVACPPKHGLINGWWTFGERFICW